VLVWLKYGSGEGLTRVDCCIAHALSACVVGFFCTTVEEVKKAGRNERGCGMGSRALPRPSRRLELAISLPSCHTLP